MRCPRRLTWQACSRRCVLVFGRMVPAIIVHGGAGAVDEPRRERCLAGCARAADAGWQVLANGGPALDAVQAAVMALEDDPEFNAGHGAVLNRDGDIEVDAALMDGNLKAGAVGAVPWLRHPVLVARALLDEGEHIMLVGQGALAFAARHGVHPEARVSLVTVRARARFAAAQQLGSGATLTADTIGACACDAAGHVAAGTSTGGLPWKHPGRVGDAPILGAGTYADDRRGAASTTGHGESILRVLMAYIAVDKLASLGSAADAAEASDAAFAAARHAVAELAERTNGHGGIILVDGAGHVAHARNTATMPWASVVGGRRDGGL